MPSPFPGMNPYLEQETVWHDFHERFCPLVAEMLTAQVRPHYVVRIDEQVYIHELSAGSRHLMGRADVGLARPSASDPTTAATGLAAPVPVRLPAVDLERLSFVEIRDRNNWQVVTVIELLSPSNQYAGPDREQHLGKRGLLLASPVHVVEIDLLRGGPRLPLENLPPCAYYVLVSRVEERLDARLWPIQLRERLPVIPIPLRDANAAAQLDLQEVLHRLYDAAGYEDYIYRGQPQPRLSAEDAVWAQQFLPSGT